MGTIPQTFDLEAILQEANLDPSAINLSTAKTGTPSKPLQTGPSSLTQKKRSRRKPASNDVQDLTSDADGLNGNDDPEKKEEGW